MVQAGVSAMAFDREVDGDTIAFADSHEIPLFALPPQTVLQDTERAIICLIVNRQAQITQQGQLIHAQLMQLSVDNRGLPAIVQSLCELTGHAVILYAKEGAPVEEALPPGWPHIPLPALPPREPAPDQIASGTWSSEPLGLMGCYSVIWVNNLPWGTLYVFGRQGELDELDRLAVEQGALVCAAEISKAQTIAAAENRLRGGLLDALLSSAPVDTVELEHRAGLAGYELDGYHIAFAFEVTGNESESSDGIRQIEYALGDLGRQHGATLIWQRQKNRIVALLGSSEPPSIPWLQRAVGTIYQQVAEAHPDLFPLTVGIGEPETGAAGAQVSLHQALQTLQVGHEVMRMSGAFLFREMGVYRLLAGLRHTDALTSFYRETLAALVEYDAESGGELVKTLSAFLAHNGNASRTAHALHLHRSSLLYRLQRISDVSGLALDDAEVRLQLFLALKILPLVTS
jgi:purine catabolism regulator